MVGLHGGRRWGGDRKAPELPQTPQYLVPLPPSAGMQAAGPSRATSSRGLCSPAAGRLSRGGPVSHWPEEQPSVCLKPKVDLGTGEPGLIRGLHVFMAEQIPIPFL